MSQSTTEPGSAKPGIPLWLIFGLVALLAVGGVVAGRAVLDMREGEDEISHPDAWDKRVQPYARLVEKKRGLSFRHPVAVEFLTDKQFRKEVTEEEEDLSRTSARRSSRPPACSARSGSSRARSTSSSRPTGSPARARSATTPTRTSGSASAAAG